MPNFDALRAANLGALAYICRPKVKPSELLACYPLDGSRADISNYACGDVYSSQSASFASSYTPQALVAGTAANTWNLYVHDLNLAQPWSFEMWLDGATSTSVAFGLSYNIRAYSGGYGKNIKFDVWSGSTSLYFNEAMYSSVVTPVWEHHAFAYNGTTLYYYYNGVCGMALNTALSGTQGLCVVTENNTTYTKAISNARFVQKCLGTSTQYPVTSTPFTGYEAL